MASTFQDTITVKFVASDKGLLNAIKSLDRATKSLLNSQAKLVDKERKGETTREKHKKQVASLIISVQALGGQWSKNTTLLGLHKRALHGDKIAMQKLKNETTKYNIKLKQTRRGILDTAHSTRILGGSFAVLRSKMLITSFAIMLVERTVVSLVKSFAAQEAVNQKLAVGLSNISDTTRGVTQRLINYSSALQQTTAFGDELITNGMAQLTTFGLNEKAIKALTPQVLNVARAIQTTSGSMPDLNSLFIAFGKSTSTAVSALTRYGVVLTDTEKAQLTSMQANERAVEIAAILDRQYGGLAEAYSKTTMGMLEAASAARGDAAEAFGEVLAPAVLKVSNLLKLMFEGLSPERVKRFGTAVAVAGLAVGIFSGNLRKAIVALKTFQIAQIKTGWGAIAAGVGLATMATLEYFGAFDEGNPILEDNAKRLKEIAIEQHALTEAQESSVKSLKTQLALLYAKTTAEKMSIRLGHSASDSEKILIDLIVKKLQTIEDVARVEQDKADKRKEDMNQWKLDETYRLDFIKKQHLATMEINKENLLFQLKLAEVRQQQFIDLGFAEADASEWVEQRKTDIIISHLEKRSALYSSFMAGYDTFINSLTDMEMTGKTRREEIWESTKNGFIKFLGEMLKQKIIQLIAEATLDKASKVSQTASVALQAKTLSALWASPAFASILATGGTNVPTALGALAAGKAVSQTIMAFAKGGEFITNKPEMIMVGDAGREHVKITPVDRPESRALGNSGGGGITLNISAPLIDETIIDTIIPAIQKAQRMNLA